MEDRVNGRDAKHRPYPRAQTECPVLEKVDEGHCGVSGKTKQRSLGGLDKPSINEAPAGRGVLVKVLRVGVNGTDKEINAAEYGAAPPGYDFLVIGHEGFGQVEAVGPNVTELQPGDYVVATVRRPGHSLYDTIGASDMTTDDVDYERGINLRHGFLTESYVDDAGLFRDKDGTSYERG